VHPLNIALIEVLIVAWVLTASVPASQFASGSAWPRIPPGGNPG
jgi:hypothetical protein